MRPEPNLVELGTGIFAFIDPEPGYGRSNCGLIIDEDGLTIVDTGTTPVAGHQFKKAILGLTEELGLPIRRVAVTSSRAAFAGGSWAFWQSAFYGTTAISEQLDAPANLEALARLLPEQAKHFHEDFETRPITHLIDEEVWLTPSCLASPAPGEGPSNLVVQTPGAEAVFAGALASFGVTPLAYDGDPVAWIKSLDALIGLGGTVIPGHGMPGGRSDLIDLRNYLTACVEANGSNIGLPSGPWDHWTDRRFDAVNIERARRMSDGDATIPDAMFELLGM